MKYQIAWSLLAVMAVGCGEVTPKEEPDGGADGPAQAKPVKVRVTGMDPTGVYGTGMADANAIVIFSGDDNTVLQQGKVNAQGEAEATVPAGSTVQTLQVLEPAANTKRVFIMTFHDVKPGDVLNAGVPRSLPGPRTTSTTMTSSFPANQSYTHTFHTECESLTPTASPFSFTFYEGCHGDTVDILAIQSSTLTPPAPTRYAVTKAPYASAGTITLNTNWQPMSTFVATMTNLPEDITNLTINRSTFMRAGVAAPIGTQGFVFGDPPAGAAAASLLYAPGVGVRAAVSAVASKAAGFPHRFEVQTADISGTQTIDYNELSVPWINSVAYTGAERKVTWTETSSGSGSPDVRIAASSFSYMRDNVSYAVTAYDIAKPSAALTLVFAPLPSAYAEFDPAQQATFTSNLAIISYVDQSNLNGYDEARVHGIGMVQAIGSSDSFADQSFRRRYTVGNSRLR